MPISNVQNFMLHRRYQKRHYEFFYGAIHKLGAATACVRNTKHKPHFTVIGMHGFLCDHRYFTHQYPDVEVELILMTASGYHTPVMQDQHKQPSWFREIPYEVGTINYDAEALVQVLENLPSTENIRVHGHSRGGAVVIEAANRRPDLFENVEVILEAPILPGTERAKQLRPFARPSLLWMAPYYGPLITGMPDDFFAGLNRLGVFGGMDADTRRKLTSMFASPQYYKVVIRNVRSFVTWTRTRKARAMCNLKRGYIIVPAVDHILDRESMLAAARQAPPGMQVIEAPVRSHFVGLEQPDLIPGLRRKSAYISESRLSANDDGPEPQLRVVGGR